jgi:toxin-antitoxin system PIN domain toxin
VSETLDVNVLVYATHRNSPFHERAKALVEQFATGPGLVYLFWPVVMGYLRLVTNPSLLDSPLSPTAARENIEGLLARANVRAAGELEDFWATYRRIAGEVSPRGNLVPDTHLVALMHQHGVATIWSHDRDLRRFSAITVRDPFAAS